MKLAQGLQAKDVERVSGNITAVMREAYFVPRRVSLVVSFVWDN
jgi:hypothetical protein